MKKALITATVHEFLKFEINDIKILKSLGYEIHVATNMNGASWLRDDGSLDELGIIKHQVDYGRNPFVLTNYRAYKQLRELMKKENYDIIHCHTPVASAIARIAAIDSRRKGTSVIYTCHGFHFHKKSSMIDWLIYYPIERMLAPFTDMIITINKEDYQVLQKFNVKHKKYIPGVGINAEYISSLEVNQEELRREFGVPDDAFMIMSIGELSKRKNHEVVIKALSLSAKENVYYLICGTGELLEYLKTLAQKLNVSNRVIFAGQQPHEKVLALAQVANLGVLPSLIEGLGLAGIETLAAGTPLVASGVHGIKDYTIDEETGLCCEPNCPEQFRDAIEKMMDDTSLYNRCKKNAKLMALRFDINYVQELMIQNYKEIS